MSIYTTRLDKIRRAMADNEIDLLFLPPSPYMYYATGIHELFFPSSKCRATGWAASWSARTARPSSWCSGCWRAMWRWTPPTSWTHARWKTAWTRSTCCARSWPSSPCPPAGCGRPDLGTHGGGFPRRAA